jgi:hypothetical protein
MPLATRTRAFGLRPPALAALAAVLLVAGCGKDSTSDKAGGDEGSRSQKAQTKAAIRGCAPQCLPPGMTEPGSLPSGSYKTHYFFAGQMRLTFEKGWTGTEDSTGEFGAAKNRDTDYRVVFWEDVYPQKDGQRVKGVPVTAGGVLDWLRANRNLRVRAPHKDAIGADLPARVVDVSIADGAVNDDPECPAKACANFLGFPQWGEPYGIAGDSVTRLYLSDVKYGGQNHLFVAAVEGSSKPDLDTRLAAAKRLIASVQVPATPGAGTEEKQ